jgi:hypothetical protein
MAQVYHQLKSQFAHQKQSLSTQFNAEIGELEERAQSLQRELEAVKLQLKSSRERQEARLSQCDREYLANLGAALTTALATKVRNF